MSNVNYLTKEGLEKLRAELHELETKGRKEIARQISEARDKGDLSENAEYDAAKDAQGHLELKISKLQQMVASAKVIDESKIDTSKVVLMSKVKIKNMQNNAVLTYSLVPEQEADLKAGKIAVNSAIGKGLLGAKVGDTVEITVPAGKIKFKIMDISI